MKSVLFSINKPHTDHIRSLLKKVELRTKPPKIDGVYKGFIYETKKYGGSGKVIGEFTAYNENTYRVYMGVPAHLAIESWVSTADILKYSDNGKKDITAISISDLIIYDEPKELGHFLKPGYEEMETLEDTLCNYCSQTEYGAHKSGTSPISGCLFCEGRWCESSYKKYLEKEFSLKHPPQSWFYVEEMG